MRKGAQRMMSSKAGHKRNMNKESDKEAMKKARVTKPHDKAEYLEEKRNMDDLWKAAFPVGTEWCELDGIFEFNWDFKHLEEALEEGGILYGKKVYAFGIAEPHMSLHKGVAKFVHVPTVVVIESSFPPSDKLAVTSIQSATERIIPMKQMKMDWIPYTPFQKRDRQVDRINFQIFCWGCKQRRAALRNMKEESVMKFQYCVPYIYNPLKEDELELEESTKVDLTFPCVPPVQFTFDWEFDELEEFADEQIEEEVLSAEQKDEFKEFVKEKVRAAKKANREARKKAAEEEGKMREDAKRVFESMKFYKFYPKPTPYVPGVVVKTPYINRYYGNAHQVL